MGMTYTIYVSIQKATEISKLDGEQGRYYTIGVPVGVEFEGVLVPFHFASLEDKTEFKLRWL